VDAAQRIGITRESLGLLEKGKRHPHAPTLAKLANGYGVTIEELFLLDEEERRDAPLGEAPSGATSGPSVEATSVEAYEERRHGFIVACSWYAKRRARQYELRLAEAEKGGSAGVRALFDDALVEFEGLLHLLSEDLAESWLLGEGRSARMDFSIRISNAISPMARVIDLMPDRALDLATSEAEQRAAEESRARFEVVQGRRSA